MKKAASIFLRAEIEPQDVELLIRWMENPHITQYLNEDPGVIRSLRQLLWTVPAPMLTFHFNRWGRFFLVCRSGGDPIGFVKLRELSPGGDYEIVYAIGEEALWGHGYGESAIHAALSMVFGEWRGRRVLAKIYPENRRSVRSVCACGFRRSSADVEIALAVPHGGAQPVAVRIGAEHRGRAHFLGQGNGQVKGGGILGVGSGKWFDHATRRGGGAVSFVMAFYDKAYPEAVTMLLGRDGQGIIPIVKKEPEPQEPKPFALPEAYLTMRQLYAYLTTHRRIDRDVVTAFVREKLLYEDAAHHNCVFVGMDEHGEAKHAHLRSTSSSGKVFRVNVEGSVSGIYMIILHTISLTQL